MANGMIYKSLAVLIDTENIPAAKYSEIVKIIYDFGSVSLVRCYGDFTVHPAANWNENIKSFALDAFQVFHSKAEKNSADIALVIDAMDLMTTNKFDAFCIVSSDGDFRGLALRLRREGLTVVGIGESKKTSATLAYACNTFVELEVANTITQKESTAVAKAAKVPAPPSTDKKLEAAARLIVESYNQKRGNKVDSYVTLSGVVSRLGKNGHATPYKICGVANWEAVVAKLPNLFETTGKGNATKIRPKGQVSSNVVAMVG